VRERQREREREREKQKQREKEREGDRDRERLINWPLHLIAISLISKKVQFTDFDLECDFL
jgi:hypothetical protein